MAAIGTYQERKLNRLCVDCAMPAAPGNIRCELHAEERRTYARDRMRRLRPWWRFNKDCIYCSGKRKAMPKVRYCAVCAEAQEERKSKKCT